MDTLFRLVSLQSSTTTTDHSFNSSTRTNSTASRSSSRPNSNSDHHNHNHNHNHHYNHSHNNHPSNNNNHFYTQSSTEEECFNFFMADNSNNNNNDQEPDHFSTTTTTTSSFSPPAPAPAIPAISGIEFSGRWATEVLEETAMAVAEKNTARVQQLMWILNELGTPYGDVDQKIAAYFLQALFSRLNNSGDRCHRTLSAASDGACSFDSTRRNLLKFQELSPWTTFGHVAANGAILEAMEGEQKLHIIDLSNTFCTQWPTLLEALATRSDETPFLRLTSVVSSASAAASRVMREIGARMEKFARLMGVPFEFNTVHHHSADISDLSFSDLNLRDDESLAVNFVNSLHSISVADDRRNQFLRSIRGLGARIVTIVEEEADLNDSECNSSNNNNFVGEFRNSVRWFRVYLEMLDESFPRTSNERLALERVAGRAVVDLVALSPEDSSERRETAEKWGSRMRSAGFGAAILSDEVCDDVKALLRRYREGWAMAAHSPENISGGMFLTWKDQPVVWASAWRP